MKNRYPIMLMFAIRLRNIFVALITFLAFGCGDSQQRVASQELAEEIQNREIRHISPGQITQAAMQAGNQITQTLQTALTHKMTASIPTEGLVQAARYCHLSQIPAADSLSKAYGLVIKRLRLKGDTARYALNDKEFQLLDAYRYSAENNLPLDPNVQQEGAFLLYTAPVVINHQVCLKCHGKIGQDLSAENYRSLSAQYQLDSLINYSSGQAIAIWLLRFDKKELVKRISN